MNWEKTGKLKKECNTKNSLQWYRNVISFANASEKTAKDKTMKTPLTWRPNDVTHVHVCNRITDGRTKNINKRKKITITRVFKRIDNKKFRGQLRKRTEKIGNNKFKTKKKEICVYKTKNLTKIKLIKSNFFVFFRFNLWHLTSTRGCVSKPIGMILDGHVYICDSEYVL